VGKYQLLKKGISMELVHDTATTKSEASEGRDFLLLQASTSQVGVEVIVLFHTLVICAPQRPGNMTRPFTNLEHLTISILVLNYKIGPIMRQSAVPLEN
jgi:hypothetical protein